MDRYEEALAKARAGKSLEEIFPEMKESEDEKIRKSLVEYFSRFKPTDMWSDLFSFSQIIAYLERQKESTWTEEDESFRKHILPRILNPNGWTMEQVEADRKLLKEFVERQKNKWLEKKEEQTEELPIRLNGLMQEYVKSGKDEEEQEHRLKCYQLFWDALEDSEFFVQKEQKPNKQEWSEDWREEDIQTRFAFYTYKDDPSVLYLSNVFVEETSRNHGFGTRILRAAEKVAETIGATTISLKVKQDSPANAWYRKNGYGYVAFEDGYDWLEKNLEYMKPDKSVEWSEKEMAYCMKLTISAIEYYYDAENPFRDKLIHWLKSLRPQQKQEWSKEDEMYLSQAIETLEHENYSILADKLKSLRPPQYCENCKLKRSVENWKPSEEQMKALKWAIEYLADIENDCASALTLLKFELQKLL